MLQGIPVKYQKLQRSSCSDFKAVDPLYYTELVSWCMQPLLYTRKVHNVCQVTTLSFWESPLKIRWKNATWKTSEKKRLGFIATIFTKRKKYQAWRKSPRSENKRENCILLPKLFWPTLRKNCSSDREFFWNSRLKAKNLKNVWDN